MLTFSFKIGNFFSKALASNGANLELADHSAMTCLHYASKNGHLDVVKYLVMEKNCYINAASSQRLTPLDLANNNLVIASFLSDAGALTMEKIVRIAATRIQALYRSYKIRTSFMQHRELMLKHERLRRNTKRNAGSFLGHVIEETHATKCNDTM